MSGEEKRRHDREPITLVVEYSGVDDLVGDFTENLSAGGTFVRTERDFEVGTTINLVLSFPGLLKPIALHGVVRWARRETDSGDRGVGIEFSSNDSEGGKLATLIDRVNQRDPALVSRVVRVLVVEDNPHVAKLIRDGLHGGSKREFAESLSFDFETAANGKEALALLESNDFDALIVDIYLPVLDGVSVIESVRGDERLEGVPIIAVSAGGNSARDAALAAGADFFLAKPMRLRDVIGTMQKLMELDDASDTSDT